MRKPQSVTRRANTYAAAKRALGTHSNACEGPLAEGWAAGYRAAMRDVRRVLMKTANDGAAVESVLCRFANDTERMK